MSITSDFWTYRLDASRFARSSSAIPGSGAPACESAPESLAELFNLLTQIESLSAPENLDGELPPTPQALHALFDLLHDSLRIIHDSPTQLGGSWRFPHAFATTDDMGGLRVEWRDSQRSVHMVIGAGEKDESYLYSNMDGVKSLDQGLNPNLLATFLLKFPVE